MSTGQNNPGGTGKASHGRGTRPGRTSFAAVAKAAREREAKARETAGEAPDVAGPAPDAGTGGVSDAGAPTVHVREKGADPFADSSEKRMMKPRAASRTIHVAAPPPVGGHQARPVAAVVSAPAEPASPAPEAAPAAASDAGASLDESAAAGTASGAPPAPVQAARVSSPSAAVAPARQTGIRGALRQVDIESRATATRTRMRAEDFKPRTSPTAIFFVVLGWVYAVSGLIAVAWAGHKASEFVEKARRPVLEEKLKWEEKLKTAQGSLDEARAKVDTKVTEATDERRRLAAEIKALEDEVARNEAKRKVIHEEMAQIQQDFKPTGEQAVDTQAKLAQVKEEFRKQMGVRGKMWSYYNKCWNELSQGFWTAMKDPAAAQMSKFYDDNKHTVFAPAAAFYAGEKYYKADWRPRAKSLYQAVQRDFAGSPYAAYAFERLQQLEARTEFKPGNYPVAPFKRFDLEPITDQEKEAKRKREEEAAKRKAEEEAKKAKGPP